MRDKRNITIVLADDHALFRVGVAAALRAEADMEVLAEMSNGREAVRAAEKLNPDILIMDISMPDLNGIDATRLVRRSCPGTKVLGLSFYQDGPMVSEIIRSGASGYLSKACDPDELANAVRIIAKGGSYLGPRAARQLVESMWEGHDSKREDFPDSPLTSREKEVLQLVAEGYKTSEIADTLFISVKTVESHRKQIMSKLKIHRVAELTKYAIQNGITSLDF